MTIPLLRILVCVDSDVFLRGLLSTVGEMTELTAHVTAGAPEEIDLAIGEGVDVLVLDQKLIDEVGPRLTNVESRPRILLVSERTHVGLDHTDQLHLVCGFFPVRSSERQQRYFLMTLLNCDRRSPSKTTCRHCPLFHTRRPRQLPLTARETEVFRMVGQLYNNSEIAEALGISIKTVEAHCANIKSKLELCGAKELLKAANDWVEGR